MWFSTAIVASTVITIISIISVYKIFLEKPALPNNKTFIEASELPAFPPDQQPATNAASPPVSTAQTPKSSATAKPKSKSSSAVGSVTVLKNNINQPLNVTGNSTVSGTVGLSGTPPSGSSLVITAKKHGTNDQAQVVDNGITAVNNASWSWDFAENGIEYDMVAVLKGKSGSIDIDYASSQTYTIKAPALAQTFSMDIGYALAAPTGTITITCNNRSSDNNWSVTVNYPLVTGALMYRMQVGTTSGGSDLADVFKNAQSVSLSLKDSVNYYAQYSVSSVSNPTSYQFSGLSSPATLRCP